MGSMKGIDKTCFACLLILGVALSGILLMGQDCFAQTDPCTPDPCQSIPNAVADTCTPIGGSCTPASDFTCTCDTGYDWQDATNECIAIPGDSVEVLIRDALDRSPVTGALVQVTDVNTTQVYSGVSDPQGLATITLAFSDPIPTDIDVTVNKLPDYGLYQALNSVFPESTWANLKADPNIMAIPYEDISGWNLPDNPLTLEPYTDSIQVLVTATRTYPGIYGNDKLEHWTQLPIPWHINEEEEPGSWYSTAQRQLMSDINDALRPHIGEDLYEELPAPSVAPERWEDFPALGQMPVYGIKTIYISGSSSNVVVENDADGNPLKGLQRLDDAYIGELAVYGAAGNETVIALNGIGEFDPNGLSLSYPQLSAAEEYVLAVMFNLPPAIDMKKYFTP